MADDQTYIEFPEDSYTVKPVDEQEWLRIAGYRRGAFINNIILLERYIDIYLSRYFTDNEDKRDELVVYVFAHSYITAINKLSIFKEIVNKVDSQFVANHPKFHSDLVDLFEKRNIFAHYLLDTSDEGEAAMKTDRRIQFLKFFKSVSRVSYSQKDWSDMSDKLVFYLGAVGDLLYPKGQQNGD